MRLGHHLSACWRVSVHKEVYWPQEFSTVVNSFLLYPRRRFHLPGRVCRWKFRVEHRLVCTTRIYVWFDIQAQPGKHCSLIRLRPWARNEKHFGYEYFSVMHTFVFAFFIRTTSTTLLNKKILLAVFYDTKCLYDALTDTKNLTGRRPLVGLTMLQ